MSLLLRFGITLMLKVCYEVILDIDYTCLIYVFLFVNIFLHNIKNNIVNYQIVSF